MISRMMLLAVVGAVVLTAALTYITAWPIGLLITQCLFSELRLLGIREWVSLAIIFAGLLFFWYLWWLGIGSNITIGFG